MADRIIRQRAARRRTHWSTQQASTLDRASTQKLLMETLTAQHSGETLLRTRGLIRVYLQTASSNGDGYAGAIGFGVVTAKAAAAGVASLPGPMADAGWDGWFVHQFFDVRKSLSIVSNGSGFFESIIDSKAMRKVTDEDVIVVVAEIILSGTATVSVFVTSRLLSAVG